MDASVIKHLSRLCRQQAEQMSANITQFVQARGVRGEAGSQHEGGGGTWQQLASKRKSGSCSASRLNSYSSGLPF